MLETGFSVIAMMVVAIIAILLRLGHIAKELVNAALPLADIVNKTIAAA